LPIFIDRGALEGIRTPLSYSGWPGKEGLAVQSLHFRSGNLRWHRRGRPGGLDRAIVFGAVSIIAGARSLAGLEAGLRPVGRERVVTATAAKPSQPSRLRDDEIATAPACPGEGRGRLAMTAGGSMLGPSATPLAE
jgi:hypothetical protein